MNKRVLFNARFNRVVNRGFCEGSCLDPRPDVKDKNSQLLDYIFCVDKRTGFPRGDIASFLGEGTNPEVKTFIEMNLLKDNVQEKSNVSIPTDIMNKMRETINDDDIAYFSRNDGEDSEQYAQRMHNYFEAEKYKNALRKQTNQLKKMIKDSVKDE